MEYIKLYEDFEPVKEKTFLYWLENNSLYKGKSGWANIKSIDCGEMDLTSLEGIDKLKRLKELYCNNNRLTSLEGIENIVNLQYLNCYSNQITSLKVIENLVNLQRLYCYNN